ncbi:hypothetical protein FF2_023654 [Malus domestica]
MPLWDRDRETEGEGDSERERGRGRSGDPRFCTVKERPRVSHRGLGFDVFLNLLINSDGEFNADGLDRFVKEVKLTECRLSYAVVAVMSPQSSGKRTLLNHLFRTKFREMDAYSGRSQTTKSIWIAKRVGSEPCTIAMDLEGTDGRERGEKAISTPLQAEERPHTSPTVANVSVISSEDTTTTLRSFWKMESTRLKDLGPKIRSGLDAKLGRLILSYGFGTDWDGSRWLSFDEGLENDLERLTKLNFDIEINENPLV